MNRRDAEEEPAKASGSSTTPAKRGRPFGSTTGGGSAAASAADSAAPASLLGPALQVPVSFAGKGHILLSCFADIVVMQAYCSSLLRVGSCMTTVISYKGLLLPMEDRQMCGRLLISYLN
ncbi:hypothetical protein HPP92_006288 [Vanilla planifolia]|uniref:Uncharacterized protein n=1 Tax=Vanilla planifolia TaxID=51239 RepID=A0A835RIF6_VANPL|nr:hypothetical protein HPP92_006288 [Vanilla planifolia]